ncbi:MAG: hypothetical protein ACYC6Y_30795, partial [Thermoguttaceae bacterium]
MIQHRFFSIRSTLLGLFCFAAIAVAQQADQPGQARKPREKEDPQRRADALEALAGQLGVGPGATIADIGAGGGRDSWTFAEIVGPSGKVFAEEIEESKTKAIQEEAAKRDLQQVKAVLGGPT